MQGRFLEAFESAFGSGMTVVLVTLVVMIPIVTSCVIVVRKIVKYIKEQAIKEQKNEEEKQKYREDVSKVSEKLGEFTSTLDTIRDEQKTTKEDLIAQLDSVRTMVNDIKRESKREDQILQQQMRNDETVIEKVSSQMNIINTNIGLLIESDKESIRALITNMYYDSIALGYIPMYKLETVETLFGKYLKENGNTFVGQMVKELRELPHMEESPTKKENT